MSDFTERTEWRAVVRCHDGSTEYTGWHLTRQKASAAGQYRSGERLTSIAGMERRRVFVGPWEGVEDV